MNDNLSLWQILQVWLHERYGEKSGSFVVEELAESFEITVPEASAMIQSQLHAQRRPNSETVYVLKREGRTRAAVWSVGQRKVDVRVVNRTLYDDIVVKVRRAYAPDLNRLKERNPRLAKYVNARIGAIMNGALVVVAEALDVHGYGDEEEE